RKAFHGFVAAELKLFREVRNRAAGIRDLKIYRCPMTSEAFDGAPPRAEWLQLAPPLRNPWFGAEMLECGVEVRD
ncbi:MAG: DUF3347 domain-containing protein, partial [Verrucomicrobiales bacterium]|nr:DUF3347 domain-containing protein [Verrucomicrobiales bacterium]